MAKTKMVSSYNEMAIESFIQIDLRYCADLLENVCADLLLEPPAGVYHIGQLNPVMVAGRSYYYRAGEEENTALVTDLTDIKTSVYDAEGNCVIPQRYMANKEKFLSNSPMFPYRGLYILKDMADWQVFNFAAFHRGDGRTLADAIGRHFHPGVQLNDEQMALIENCCTPIRKELQLFLGDANWNIFFARLHNATLQLEKCMDWRAWEWEQKHGDQYRAGKYSTS